MVGEVFGKIIDIIGAAIGKIASFVEAVRNMINAVISAYNKLPLPNISLISPFRSSMGATGGTPSAISGGGSSGGAGGISSIISGLGSGGTGTGAGGTGGGTSTRAGQLDALAKLQADAAFAGFLLDNLQGQGIFTDVRQAQSLAFNEKLAASIPAPTINITVNGAIDSESTARQMVEILNDSATRGTLGALSLSGLKL